MGKNVLKDLGAEGNTRILRTNLSVSEEWFYSIELVS